MIKKYQTRLMLTLLKVFWLVPVRNKNILFLSFGGEQYSDSPKYIFEFLYRKFGCQYTYIWGFKNPQKFKDLSGIKAVKVESFRFFFSLLTSKAIITNNMINTYFPIRKSQIVLNTWHGGGALKKVGLLNKNISSYEKYFFKIQEKKYSAYSCDSRLAEYNLFRKGFGYTGEILRYGLPRNAVLFSNNETIKKKVLDQLQINSSSIILLYAPTYRGNAQNAKFDTRNLSPDFDRISKALFEKYGKPIVVLFRGHHEFKNGISIPKLVNVTEYRDMQELIMASDIMITDYSSCMWDMAITKKPVFLYTPDVEDYSVDPGFFIDYHKLPFTFCKTNDELIKEMESFDLEDYMKRIDAYFEMMGSYENSDSLKSTCEWIIRKIQ